MFVPSPTGGNYKPVPPGNHLAICYRFIDLGTQKGEWKGKPKFDRKVILSWELPNELMTEGDYAGQPFTIGNRYTWSMSEKATLRKILESWRNKAFTEADFVGDNRFNIKNIIGKPCMLSIVHSAKDGTTYSNISSVASIPKGMSLPTPVNSPIYLSLESALFDNAVFDGLSDKIRETIKQSPEYQQLVGGNAGQQHSHGDPRDLDDEVPF